MEEQIEWKISGMSCTNCAQSVEKQLKSCELESVQVDFMRGQARFTNPTNKDLSQIEKSVNQLGFKILHEADSTEPKALSVWQELRDRLWGNSFRRFIFCLVFTVPLWLHMFISMETIPLLHHPLFQLILSLPVLITGMAYFGKSGWYSLKKGVPNMNVLVSLGALAAFFYSLYGTLTGQAEQYLFYETTATILTLVFMGNWLESRTVAKTQSAIKNLIVSQKIMANMLTYSADQEELVFPVDSAHLKVGDLVMIKTGEFIPMDCKILSGTAEVDESILTGESLPVLKSSGDMLVGNSLLTTGHVKAYITAVGKDTVLQHILQLVQQAQQDKPPMQQLADRISAVFVPVVLGLAALTFIINLLAADQGFTDSLMRSIAVLVIACPCAMGLATPAGIAVGLGRAAKKGILFKNAHALESFKNIRQVVFDKTGTLTSGQLQLDTYDFDPEHLTEEQFKGLIFTLEKYASHPLAKTITRLWKPAAGSSSTIPKFKKVTEIKGVGVLAEGPLDEKYYAVSEKKAAELSQNQALERKHHLYLLKDNQLLGWVDFKDTIRPEAEAVVQSLKNAGIRTCLLSGDNEYHCKQVATTLKIDQYYSGKTPQQKQELIKELSQQTPTMMVGDGINDSPALAAATVGVSLSSATQIAIQTADVLLIRQGLTHLPLAMGLGKHTHLTIQQNLFWAFAYNVLAIPIAACGLLSPSFAALAMGLSDVVLGFNSIRLLWKRVLPS